MESEEEVPSLNWGKCNVISICLGWFIEYETNFLGHIMDSIIPHKMAENSNMR